MKVHELKRDRSEKAKEEKKLLALIESGDLKEEALEKRDAEHKSLTEEINSLDEQIEAAEERYARIIKKPSNSDSGELIGGTSITGKERFEDDPKRGYANIKDLFVDAIAAVNSGSVSPRLQSLSAAAGSDEHSSANDPYGGFLVPEGFSNTVLSVDPEETPLIQRALEIPMGNARILNIPAKTDKNHSSSVSGGFTASRKAQTAAASASRAQLERVKLEATPLYGFSYATDELIEDSPIAVAAFIEAGFQEEMPSQIMREMIRGTGSGEMEGILNADCKIEVSRATTDEINGADITNMRARAWRFNRCIWVANHDTYPQLVSAHTAHTNSDTPVFTHGNGTDVPDRLLGQPIFFSEYASTLANTGDLMLVDMSQYLYGTKGGVNSAQSIHFRFDRAETAFRFSMNNAGKWWWRSALTPNQSSSTLSPVVVLNTNT